MKPYALGGHILCRSCGLTFTHTNGCRGPCTIPYSALLNCICIRGLLHVQVMHKPQLYHDTFESWMVLDYVGATNTAKGTLGWYYARVV